MRLVSLVAVALLGADAVRTRRASSDSPTKFIEGVPILNYQLAYGGASLSEEEKVGYDKQRWVVIVQNKVKQALLKKLCTQVKCTKQGHPERGGVPFVEIESCEGGLKNLLKNRLIKKLVRFVEPVTDLKAIPEFEAQASSSWGLDRIGAPKRANEGAGTHVYVLDTGVLSTHDDFGGRVIPTLDMTSDKRVYCDPENADSCTNDKQGHGTHCAGTTSGASYGVAPLSTVHAVKVLGDDGGGSFSWSFEALDFISTDGERPAVASMSLGGQGVLAAMGESVQSAVEAGVVVVVAGGNSNSDACGFSPAFAPAAITVGSSTSRDKRSSFSNYGSCTDIWAPGSDITSASHRSNDGDATMSGTSMACPHVSGASALVLERSPELSADEVLEELLNFAEDGALTGLMGGDTNRLLYVGDDAVPAPPIVPTPAPPPLACPSVCKAWYHCFYSVCETCSSLCGGGSLFEDKAGKGGKGGKKSKKTKATADC